MEILRKFFEKRKERSILKSILSAANGGDMVKCKSLLNSISSTDAINHALHLATGNDQSELVNLIISRGAETLTIGLIDSVLPFTMQLNMDIAKKGPFIQQALEGMYCEQAQKG
jgi:hypothetical protein